MISVRLAPALATLAMLLLVPGAAAGPVAPAVPPQPLTLYGTVQANGTSVALGTEITAWCGEVPAGSTTKITLYGGASWYSNLDVRGDDPDEPGKDGCAAGETVSFKVAGLPAAQTTTWRSDSARLDLAVSGTPITVTPSTTPSPTGTATVTSTPTVSGTPSLRLYLPLILR